MKIKAGFETIEEVVAYILAMFNGTLNNLNQLSSVETLLSDVSLLAPTLFAERAAANESEAELVE